jgi:AcrR family transcriptional regulator
MNNLKILYEIKFTFVKTNANNSSYFWLTATVSNIKIILGDLMSEQKNKVRIPQQQRGIQTKKQIIAAAMRLFSQKGFHATNSKEIAEAAGVATGCFYSYFTDKKAVFYEALQLYLDQFNAILQKHITEIHRGNFDKKDFLKELILSILEAHRVFTDFHNELLVMYYSDPEIRKLTEKYDTNVIQFTLGYLKEVQNRLRVSDLEAAASVIYCAVHSVVDTISFSKEEGCKQRLIDQLVDMVAVYLFGDNEESSDI